MHSILYTMSFLPLGDGKRWGSKYDACGDDNDDDDDEDDDDDDDDDGGSLGLGVLSSGQPIFFF